MVTILVFLSAMFLYVIGLMLAAGWATILFNNVIYPLCTNELMLSIPDLNYWHMTAIMGIIGLFSLKSSDTRKWETKDDFVWAGSALCSNLITKYMCTFMLVILYNLIF